MDRDPVHWRLGWVRILSRLLAWVPSLLPLGLALLTPRLEATSVDPDVQFVEDLPNYQPSRKVSGTIRLWGHGSPKHDFMGSLIGAWAAGFAVYQPEVKLENHLYGTASAIGALYTGAGDLAILGEEISPAARRAFEREEHYPPTGIDIATGSLDVNFFDYAHMIFVHKDNPLPGLTLRQLDGIFGAEHRRGGPNIRTWNELGLPAPWADRRILPLGWQADVDFGLFFQEAVLEGSHRWSPDLREFVHVLRADGSQYDHGQQILDTLAGNPDAIAISNVRYTNPSVRVVPLARAAGDPFYAPTRANLISQRYPLVRIIPAFFDRAPGSAVDPKIREFLEYILSREGQRILIQNSDYLPLGPEINAAQRGKLQ